MPETKTAATTNPPAQTKGKVERTHHIIHTLSMALGIIGAIGGGGVWLAANIYVGDVEIQPDKPVQSLIVKVYDKKGQEATYHLNKFQLMPGNYHLEVTPDENKTQHAQVEVKFGQNNLVPVSVTAGSNENAGDVEEQPQRRHWWQFWRK